MKFHLAAMANRDRMATLTGQFKPKSKLNLPLVVDLHPALTCLSTMTSNYFLSALNSDPLLKVLIPESALFVTYRKLPNLKKMLCSPDQNMFADENASFPQLGYIDTGCRCQVCQISLFGKYARSPSMPGFKIPLKSKMTCKSGPAVVYHLLCASGKDECKRAHYVGMASTSNPSKKPMSNRWAVHKHHHKAGINKCAMTEHLISCHKKEDAQSLIKITLLEVCETVEEAREKELAWTFDLFAFVPTGLNKREETLREEIF